MCVVAIDVTSKQMNYGKLDFCDGKCIGVLFPEFEPTGMAVDNEECVMDDVGVIYW